MTKNFIKAATRAELPPGGKKLVEVDGRAIAVFHCDGGFYAIDDVCTHDGGVLGEGELDDNAVECPRHGGRFDLFTGRVLSLPPVIAVRAYETRLVGDDVQVVMPE